MYSTPGSDGQPAQHRVLAAQQGQLEPQPVAGRGRREQGLLVGQVEDHRRADEVGQHERVVRQPATVVVLALRGEQRRPVGRGRTRPPTGPARRRRRPVGFVEPLDVGLEVGQRTRRRRAAGTGSTRSSRRRSARRGRTRRRAARRRTRRRAARGCRRHPTSRPSRMATTPNMRGSSSRSSSERPDEQPVALLEDVQREQQAGEQHAAQREQRDPLGHGGEPRRPGTALGRPGRLGRALPRLSRMIRRIDLRGADLDALDLARGRAACRARRRRRRSTWSGRSVRRRPRARRGRAARPERAASTASARRRCGCPRPALTAALDRLDPDVRAALEESIRRARLVHADQRRTDTTTQVVDRRHRAASAGCRSTGSASTSPVVAPSTRAAWS